MGLYDRDQLYMCTDNSWLTDSKVVGEHMQHKELMFKSLDGIACVHTVEKCSELLQ